MTSCVFEQKSSRSISSLLKTNQKRINNREITIKEQNIALKICSFLKSNRIEYITKKLNKKVLLKLKQTNCQGKINNSIIPVLISKKRNNFLSYKSKRYSNENYFKQIQSDKYGILGLTCTKILKGLTIHNMIQRGEKTFKINFKSNKSLFFEYIEYNESKIKDLFSVEIQIKRNKMIRKRTEPCFDNDQIIGYKTFEQTEL